MSVQCLYRYLRHLGMVLTINGVSRGGLRFMYGISMYAFKNMLYQQETRECFNVCPSCCGSKRKLAMLLIWSIVKRMYSTLNKVNVFTATQNCLRRAILRNLTQKIVLLRYLAQKIPTCWYLLR